MNMCINICIWLYTSILICECTHILVHAPKKNNMHDNGHDNIKMCRYVDVYTCLSVPANKFAPRHRSPETGTQNQNTEAQGQEYRGKEKQRHIDIGTQTTE